MNIIKAILDTGGGPLDFLKSVTWLANVGHFLGGYAVMLTVAYWHGSLETWGWALFGYVLVKEYVVDLLFESGETVGSSTVDALGYALGAAAAGAEVFFR